MSDQYPNESGGCCDTCCVRILLCGRCREIGCWKGCCCCIAKFMSYGKCMSIMPFWPLVSVLMVIAASIMLSYGLDLMKNSLNVYVSDFAIQMSYYSVAAMIIVDLVFAYSVCSNKARIHNIHWNAEGCSGYRIKDSGGPCSCLLRTICKFYNWIIFTLNWLTFFLSITLFTMLAFSFAGSIFIAAICDLEREKGGNSSVALDNLIRDAYERQERLNNDVGFTQFIRLNKDTTSADLCNNTDDLNNGALFIIIGGILGVVGQVIMLVSWQVVSSVAWRHMKDLSYDKRKGGRQEKDDVDDIELSRMRLQGGLGGQGPGSSIVSPGASSMAFGSQRDCYGDNYAPSANSPGSYMRSSGDSQFPPPSFPGPQGSSFGQNAQTTQDI